MGGSYWSDDFYTSRKVDRASKGIDEFDYDKAVKTSSNPADHKVHDRLNPFGVTRESRDSKEHPKSRAVIVDCDVTGSMGNNPRIIQANLPKLLGLLTRKGYISDPQILFAANGDATCDRAPVQVGQFESGNEMEDDLSRLYLEGGGGGSFEESYDLIMYFAARHTSIDCFEKRGEKGYLFIIGDEKGYPRVSASQVKKIFGDSLQADIPFGDMVKEVSEKYEVFFIIPRSGSYYSNDKRLESFWKEHLGQRVLFLDTPQGICECIALAIGLNEGAIDLDEGVDHISTTADGSKVDALVVKSVRTSVEGLVREGAGLAKVTGSLPVPTKGVTTGAKRL